jgi:hypothetical protein
MAAMTRVKIVVIKSQLLNSPLPVAFLVCLFGFKLFNAQNHLDLYIGHLLSSPTEKNLKSTRVVDQLSRVPKLLGFVLLTTYMYVPFMALI